jgi:hypothetical protein
MLMKAVTFYDNVLLHLTRNVQGHAVFHELEGRGYPICSPDISLCDFDVFGQVKKAFKGFRFGWDEESRPRGCRVCF